MANDTMREVRRRVQQYGHLSSSDLQGFLQHEQERVLQPLKADHLFPGIAEAMLFERNIIELYDLIFTAPQEALNHPIPLQMEGEEIVPLLINSQEVPRTLNMLAMYGNAAKSAVQSYDNFFKKMEKKITLDVIPDPVLDDVILGQGRIFLQTSIKTPGYHALDIQTYNCGNCTKLHAEIAQRSEHGSESLEEAQLRYDNPNQLITRLIAGNTQQFALEETVIPVLEQKYLTLIQS